jgi:hypothetical protein
LQFKVARGLDDPGAMPRQPIKLECGADHGQARRVHARFRDGVLAFAYPRVAPRRAMTLRRRRTAKHRKQEPRRGNMPA